MASHMTGPTTGPTTGPHTGPATGPAATGSHEADSDLAPLVADTDSAPFHNNLLPIF